MNKEAGRLIAGTFFFSVILTVNGTDARTLLVGSGRTYGNLQAAAAAAQPGDTLSFAAGTHATGQYAADLQGTAGQWIVLRSEGTGSAVFDGGSQAFQLSDPAYLRIEGFVFQNQTGNGVNIDDGGSYASPAKHLIFENCLWRDMSATGNNDQLKLSGLDSFEVRKCRFVNGSAGGSGIDMVGCHAGLFIDNYFENQGSNSIQAKGGSQFVRIERNFFKNGGERALNLGGSTGLPFFRPLDATFEAADLQVYSNCFTGSQAPIAYVGSLRVEVVNNTIYKPTNWVVRILQETVDTARFSPCGSNIFRNNIIYLGNISTECNVGSNTDPSSFHFSNNLWYNFQNSTWSGPRGLPVTDSARIVNQNPLLADPDSGDFSIAPTSPAIGKGRPAGPTLDFLGRPFSMPPSIGAVEGKASVVEGSKSPDHAHGLYVIPNPSRGLFRICDPSGRALTHLRVFDCKGREVWINRLAPSMLPAGVYLVRAIVGGAAKTVKFIIL